MKFNWKFFGEWFVSRNNFGLHVAKMPINMLMDLPQISKGQAGRIERLVSPELRLEIENAYIEDRTRVVSMMSWIMFLFIFVLAMGVVV